MRFFFPYYIFPSATQVSSSFSHVAHLLPAAPVGLQAGPARLERRGASGALLIHSHWPPGAACSAAGCGAWRPSCSAITVAGCEGPTPPDCCGDPLCPRNPGAAASSSCQLPRPGIRVSFTKLGHRRLLHKMGLLIIPALLARRIRSAARVLA